MTPRFRRILMILLLFAASAPPPKVTNVLITEAVRHDQGHGRKTVQARGRNRVNPPIRAEYCRIIARVGGGFERPRPSRRISGGRPESPAPLLAPSRLLYPPATLRLRC